VEVEVDMVHGILLPPLLQLELIAQVLVVEVVVMLGPILQLLEEMVVRKEMTVVMAQMVVEAIVQAAEVVQVPLVAMLLQHHQLPQPLVAEVVQEHQMFIEQEVAHYMQVVEVDLEQRM
jgi:hypothetical protein